MSDDGDVYYAFDGMYYHPSMFHEKDDYDFWYDDDVRKCLEEMNSDVVTKTDLLETNSAVTKPSISNIINLSHQRKVSEITKLIAGLVNKEHIQNVVIKKLFHDNLNDMIIQYSKDERVPFEYITIAKQPNCLRILMAGYLKTSGNYSLSQEINDEIDAIIESISRNDEMETAYQRVNRIQKFLHKKIDQKHGEGRHFYLPVNEIRNLLSTARLHLNIQDFTYKDINSLAYIIDMSNQQSAAETKKPKKGILPNGKKYEKTWIAGQMQATIPGNVRQKILDIIRADKALPTDLFKSIIIDIYTKI